MLYCLISFILGYLVCRMMGNGFRVGGQEFNCSGCINGRLRDKSDWSPASTTEATNYCNSKKSFLCSTGY